jgi:5-methylcytosine-specific restriction endonuclease McrA
MMQIKKEHRNIVFYKYNGKCAYCGTDLDTFNKFHVDHIKPIRRDLKGSDRDKYDLGKSCLENYNPSCLSCNSSKSTLDLEKWRTQISKKYKSLLKSNSSFRLLDRFGIIEDKEKKVKFYFETI